MTSIRCPKCNHPIYMTSTTRKRSIDPSAFVDLPELSDGDRWLTKEQVAAKLGVRPGTVHSMTSRNRFPKAEQKWRGRNYWKLSTIESWLNEARQVDQEPEPYLAQTPPRGKGGRFIKVEKVEIVIDEDD